MGTLDKASEAEVGTETSTVSEREQARKRLQTQRDFASHVGAGREHQRAQGRFVLTSRRGVDRGTPWW
jgi:hypothetical protein